ncbi:hypothetical protein VTK73DRAFT_6523 [Phialemonium thermophilum]|uniref:Uncharacterized protein n=1 Tax=Phialemonium thermophilum TaxID=223376 RepID=A0ABR3WJA8_9PEZI
MPLFKKQRSPDRFNPLAELPLEGLAKLAELLYRHPDYGTNQPAKEWLANQEEQIAALPRNLSLHQGPNLVTFFGMARLIRPRLCRSHGKLKAELIRWIYSQMEWESTRHVHRINVYRRYFGEDGCAPEVCTFLDRLTGVASLYLDPLDFAHHYGIRAARVAATPSESEDVVYFGPVANGCPACALALVGGRPKLLVCLRANMLARARRKTPRLLLLVDAWIRALDPLGLASSTMRQSEELGAQLRRIRLYMADLRRSRRNGNPAPAPRNDAYDESAKATPDAGLATDGKSPKSTFQDDSRYDVASSRRSHDSARRASLHSPGREHRRHRRSRGRRVSSETKYDRAGPSKAATSQSSGAGRYGTPLTDAQRRRERARYSYTYNTESTERQEEECEEAFEEDLKEVQRVTPQHQTRTSPGKGKTLADTSLFEAQSAIPPPLNIRKAKSKPEAPRAPQNEDAEGDSGSWVSCSVHSWDGDHDDEVLPSTPRRGVRTTKPSRSKSPRKKSAGRKPSVDVAPAAPSSVYSTDGASLARPVSPANSVSTYMPARRTWLRRREQIASTPLPTLHDEGGLKEGEVELGAEQRNDLDDRSSCSSSDDDDDDDDNDDGVSQLSFQFRDPFPRAGKDGARSAYSGRHSWATITNVSPRTTPNRHGAQNPIPPDSPTSLPSAAVHRRSVHNPVASARSSASPPSAPAGSTRAAPSCHGLDDDYATVVPEDSISCVDERRRFGGGPGARWGADQR